MDVLHDFSVQAEPNDDPQFRQWMGAVQDGTPDGSKLHAIIENPRDSRQMYFAMSGGGVHETVDGGRKFMAES